MEKTIKTTRQMKLYTEEEVLKRLRGFHTHEINVQLCMLKLKPIKLPSDEEIENEAKDIYPINVGGDMWMANRDEVNKGYKQEGFIDGAKWVIEHIKQQEK